MIAVSPKLTPYYCHGCGRMEDVGGQTCPSCHSRRQHVSRFEWFLADAVEDRLRPCGLSYALHEQHPVRDRRGFTWYFDLLVIVGGVDNGCVYAAELIEVNGQSHLTAHTRDDDKFRAVPEGWTFRIVANDECRRDRVQETAARIVASLLRRAL